MTDSSARVTTGNRLLASLPANEYERLRPHLTRVELAPRQIIHFAETPIEHVYFPESAVLSYVFTTEDGTPLEVGTVGSNGVANVCVALGTDRTPNSTEVLLSGAAHRMSADVLRAEVKRDGALGVLLRRYAQAASVHAGQMQVCMRLHSQAERLAGWLLLIDEATQHERMPLTHADIGMMLGVTRSSISTIAGQLQAANLIDYSRGYIRVLDRHSTADYACNCFRIIHDEYERVFASVIAR